MAFVGIKVRDDVKVLWVDAAVGEGVSLSEWLRGCAAARLAAGEAGRGPGRAETPGHVAQDEASVSDGSRVSPAANPGPVDPTLERRLAEAREMIGGARKQVRPDFKKGKTK